MDNKTINFNIDTTKTNPIYLPYLVKENDALEINVSIFENNQKVNLTFNDVFITFRNAKTNDLFYEKEANEVDENIAIFIVNSSVLNQTGEIIGDIVIKRRLKQVTSNNFIFKVLPANAQRVLEGAEKYIQTWAELRELITEANKMLEENKEVFEILGENKDSLTALGEINKLLDSKIDKITEITGTADDKINSLTSLNSQAQQNIQNLINLGSNIDFQNVAGELGNLKEDLKNLKTDNTANEKVITELRQKIKTIEDKIKEINTSGGSGSDEEIKEILSMIYQNQENIKNNSTSISNLQKTDTELSSFTNSLNNSVKSINTEITKIKEDIESLKNNNANNSGNNTGNTGGTGTTTPDTGNQTPTAPTTPSNPDNLENENSLQISTLREEFYAHRDTLVEHENGIHGIRYKDKKLSAYNKETQTWDIISTDNIIVPPTTEGGGTGGGNTGGGSNGGSGDSFSPDETVTQGGKYKVMFYGMTFTDDRNYDNFVDYLGDIKDLPAQSAEIKKFLGWYPCIVKDGKEIARLHPDNYNLLENGESADTIYEDKCLKMICFPRRGFKFNKMGEAIEVAITNNPNAPNYDYTAFQNYGKDFDCFYLMIESDLPSNSKIFNNVLFYKDSLFRTVDKFIHILKNEKLPYNIFGFRQATYLSTIYLLYYKCSNLDINGNNWLGLNDSHRQISVYGFDVYGTNDSINYRWDNSISNELYEISNLPYSATVISSNGFYDTANILKYIKRIIGNNSAAFLPGSVMANNLENKEKSICKQLIDLPNYKYKSNLSVTNLDYKYTSYIVNGIGYGNLYYSSSSSKSSSNLYKKLQCFGNEINPDTFNPDAPTGSGSNGSTGSGSGSISPEHGEKLTEFLNTLLKDVNKNKEDIEELFDLIDDIEIGEGGGSSGGGSSSVITPDLTSIRNDLTRLETKLTEAERNITTLQAEHEEINLKIETNKEKIELNVDEINEIRKDIANLGTGEGASADLAELTAEIESLKTDVEGIKEHIKELHNIDDEVHVNTAKIEEMTVNIEGVEHNLEETYNYVKDRFSGIDEGIAENKTDIEKLKQDLENITAIPPDEDGEQQEAIINLINQNSEKIVQNTADINTLKTSQNVQAGAIAELNTNLDLKADKENITELEEKIEENKTELETVKENVKENTDNIAELLNNKNEVEEKITELEAKAPELEEKIKEVKESVIENNENVINLTDKNKELIENNNMEIEKLKNEKADKTSFETILEKLDNLEITGGGNGVDVSGISLSTANQLVDGVTAYNNQKKVLVGTAPNVPANTTLATTDQMLNTAKAYNKNSSLITGSLNKVSSFEINSTNNMTPLNYYVHIKNFLSGNNIATSATTSIIYPTNLKNALNKNPQVFSDFLNNGFLSGSYHNSAYKNSKGNIVIVQVPNPSSTGVDVTSVSGYKIGSSSSATLYRQDITSIIEKAIAPTKIEDIYSWWIFGAICNNYVDGFIYARRYRNSNYSASCGYYSNQPATFYSTASAYTGNTIYIMNYGGKSEGNANSAYLIFGYALKPETTASEQREGEETDAQNHPLEEPTNQE